MFKVIKTTGEELGFADALRCIKYSADGTLIEATKDDAIGVAYKGTAYNLPGHNEIPDADTVLTVEVDGGEEVATLKERLENQSAELLQADETAIALYESIAQQNDVIAQQDEALLELYERIGG